MTKDYSANGIPLCDTCGHTCNQIDLKQSRTSDGKLLECCPDCVRGTFNDVPNMHAIVVKYHGPTNSRGSRVSMYSPRFEQRTYIPYDYGAHDICEMAYKVLTARGFDIIGIAETDKNSYTLLSSTFGPIK